MLGYFCNFFSLFFLGFSFICSLFFSWIVLNLFLFLFWIVLVFSLWYLDCSVFSLIFVLELSSSCLLILFLDCPYNEKRESIT